jgi:putative ABC transport system permease protein
VNIRDKFVYAARSLKKQKWRSVLTILGVLIGIAAIVALTSLGDGFEQTITGQLESGFATDTLVVTKKSGTFEQPDPSFQLYYDNKSAIQDIEHVEMAIPVISVTCNVTFEEQVLENYLIYGVNFENYSYVYSDSFTTASGSIPTESNSSKIVVGSSVGQITEVNGEANLTQIFGSGELESEVAGVLEEIGGVNLGGGPTDRGIYLQIEKAIDTFNTEIVSNFIVLLEDDSDTIINSVTSDLEDLFNDQVSVLASTAILDTISGAFDTIQIFLTAIAGISLIVAGIGIMNIMIVSLMERTREIGILKAIGMKNGSIMVIFLFETLLIGVIGSLLGLGTGWIIANVFGRILGGLGGGGSAGFGGAPTGMGGLTITPVFSPTLILQAMVFGTVISVVFGLYPAWKAARLEPVEALRYE